MRKWAAACVVGIVSLLTASAARAGEIDILVEKLVEKGVITAGEGQEILTETKEEVRTQIAKGKEDTLPSWIQTMKLKGDFRFRYQDDHTKTSGSNTNEKTRARIRMRLGVEAKANEKLKVGVGIATGKTGDARSTNQSLTDSFDKKPVILDYAYAEYMPVTWATLIAGKMRIPFWEPGDMIWDTDITPEGGALNLAKSAFGFDWFLNTGVFVIDENSNDADDPMLYSVQPGFQAKLSDTVTLKGAVAYQWAASVRDRQLDLTSSSNSTIGGKLRYDYDMLWPALELSIKEPFKALGIGLIDIPYLGFFGEYVTNVASGIPDEDKGFMVGAKLGAEKVAAFGEWQVRYNYVMLEKDSVLDILPDSDRNGGKTGTKAHELMFDFGLGKNTWIGLDVYRSRNSQVPSAGTNRKAWNTLVQVDWNMKF